MTTLHLLAWLAVLAGPFCALCVWEWQDRA
jgi:hypothetical protein